MNLPLRDGSHRGGRSPGLDHGAFELVGRPLGHRRSDGIAVGSHAQHPQRGGAMVGRVRVQFQPAVGGLIVAGDRIPCRRNLPPVRNDRSGEPDRRQPPIDVDDLIGDGDPLAEG